MKLAEFNRISYERNPESSEKPALIRNFNLAAMTAVGALNGVLHLANGDEMIKNHTVEPIAESIFSPFDKKFYDFISSSKSSKWNSVAKKFQGWLSPDNTKIHAIGNKTGVSLKRMARGAALLAAIYTVPKMVTYMILKAKEKKA